MRIAPPKVIFCAQEQIRTATPVKAPPPQSGASTNFATWAGAYNLKLKTYNVQRITFVPEERLELSRI